jgi:hypothetical protein
LNQLAILAETVHAAVAIAIGHIQIARWAGHQFGRVVERPRRAQRQDAPVFTAGIGMLAARAKLFQELAVKGVNLRYVVCLIGEVNHVVHNLESMRAFEYARTPRAEVFAVRAENHHCRVFALEHIKPVLRIGGYAADHAERFACGQLGKVFDVFVGIGSGADFHVRSPCCLCVRCHHYRPLRKGCGTLMLIAAA